MANGLLDFLKTPAGQGLLAAGLGAAATAGRRGAGPLNALGQGGLMGLQAYSGAQEQELQLADRAKSNEVRDMQIAQMRDSMSRENAIRDAAKNAYTPSVPGMGGFNSSLPPELQVPVVPGKPGGFDTKGFVSQVMGIDPIRGMEWQTKLKPENPFGKVDPKDYTAASVQKFAQTGNHADLVPARKLDVVGNRAVNLYETPAGSVMDNIDPNKPFNILGGRVVANPALQQYEKDKARAGASSVHVNTEKSLMNEIAGGLGKSITDAKGGAQAALGTIGTVNRLMDALDSGKVMAGPGTTFRQYGLQIGNMLGIAGQNSQEKLVNTRQAIQSLAQLELDAAQQMKGQGPITESERSIIRRAASGDIDGMTTQELRVLGGVLDRNARVRIRGYNTQVQPLTKNPNAAPLAPFLIVEEPPERQPASAPNVLRFDANGNPIR